jgi:amino acid adenylation domain-containing protein
MEIDKIKMEAKKSAANIFWDSADRFPDNLALWVKGNEYNYADLRQRSLKIASAFSNNEGDFFGEHLAILGNKGLGSYCGIIAGLLVGMIYMPLSPRFPVERNIFMCRKVEAKGLIVETEFCDIARDVLSQFYQRIVVVFPENDDLPNWISDFPQHRFFCSKDLVESKTASPHSNLISESGAYNLFTSGSTGNPKSVLVTHGNLLSYLKNVGDLIEITPDDKCTQLFDHTFDPSVHDMFFCWQVGAALFSLPSQSASLAGRLVSELGLTAWFSVPNTAALLKARPNSFSSLRYSLFIGEALTVSLVESWSKAAPNSILLNLYGPTEATIALTAFKYEKGGNKDSFEEMAPIGWPFKEQLVCVVDQDLLPVKKNETGELCLSGSQVTHGYYRDEALTRKKFIPLPHRNPDIIWYRTGDLVHWDETKGLIFHGRADRQVKIRGFRAELSEIETWIKKIAETEFVAVVEIPAKINEGILGTVAFVNHSSKGEMEIIQYCKKRLPDYMVPEKVFFIDPFPMNVAGKVNHKELKGLAYEWKKNEEV